MPKYKTVSRPLQVKPMLKFMYARVVGESGLPKTDRSHHESLQDELPMSKAKSKTSKSSTSAKAHPKQQSAPAKSTNPLTPRVLVIIAAVVVLSGIGLFVAFNRAPDAPAVAANADTSANVQAQPAVQSLSPDAYNAEFIDSDHILIDVRTPEEFASGHISGAVNIPLDQIGNRISEIPQDKPIVLYCRSGNRSNQAAAILEKAGLTGIYDLGGVIAWTAAGYPLE